MNGLLTIFPLAAELDQGPLSSDADASRIPDFYSRLLRLLRTVILVWAGKGVWPSEPKNVGAETKNANPKVGVFL